MLEIGQALLSMKAIYANFSIKLYLVYHRTVVPEAIGQQIYWWLAGPPINIRQQKILASNSSKCVTIMHRLHSYRKMHPVTHRI